MFGGMDGLVRGFVKLKKKFRKSEKNSEFGGWVKPQIGFFWGEMLCFCIFCVVFIFLNVSKKNEKMDRVVGGCRLTDPSFSRIFGLFLT